MAPVIAHERLPMLGVVYVTVRAGSAHARQAVKLATEFGQKHDIPVLLNSGLALKCTTHFTGLFALHYGTGVEFHVTVSDVFTLAQINMERDKLPLKQHRSQ